jgi:TIR domain
MSKIFISYRRSDSADVAGRIFDHLRQHFGRDFLFKDVDSIPAGADFRTVIADTIKSCDVVIVIIGRGWLTATSKGARRLDDPEDYVRIEIETALERKITIIPVLVGGAEMPSSDVLPASLQTVAFRNAVSVRPDPDFSHDVRRLISGVPSAIQRTFEKKV